MRRSFLAVAAGCMLFSACGGTSGSGSDSSLSSRVLVSSSTPPKVRVRPGPAPRQLIVEDLETGAGTPIKSGGDEIIVHYVAVDQRTGGELYNTWTRGGPSKFHLEETREGWQQGLVGMKTGGRRELITPSELAYGTGPVIYVIELLKVS